MIKSLAVKTNDDEFLPPDFESEQDKKHRLTMQRTGNWGRAGAGALIYAKDTGRFLFALRSHLVTEPNTYGMWGGALDDGETPVQGVIRELREESGYTGGASLHLVYVFEKPEFKYFNYVAVVDTEFTPSLDWENSGFKWCKFGKWPLPLHPGVMKFLEHSFVDIHKICLTYQK